MICLLFAELLPIDCWKVVEMQLTIQINSKIQNFGDTDCHVLS